MDSSIVTSIYLRPLVRWSARATSLLLFGFVVFMVIGHGGLPNILQQPMRVQLEFCAMGLMMFGLVIGWVREGLGGLLVLFGLGALNVVELAVNSRPALGAFPLFALPGALFLLSAVVAWREEKLHKEDGPPPTKAMSRS